MRFFEQALLRALLLSQSLWMFLHPRGSARRALPIEDMLQGPFLAPRLHSIVDVP